MRTLCTVVRLAALAALFSGSAARAADFNGDGFDDLAIWSTAGHVTVLFGSNGAGLTTTGALELTPAQFSLADDVAFGIELVAGDFNHDGFDDLAIGAPGVMVSGNADAGAIVIVPGKSSGLDVAAATTWNEDTPGVPGSSHPPVSGLGDGFGSRLAVGDFDGDGFDDLAASTNGNIGGKALVGNVIVLHGSNGGLTAANSKLFQQGKHGVKGKTHADAEFGSQLGVGDLNRDGKDDLVIAIPGGLKKSTNPPAVMILFGSSSSVTAKKSRVYTMIKFGEPADNARPADALAVADFGDGKTSLAVGIGSHAFATGRVAVVPAKSGKKKLDLPALEFWSEDTVDATQTASQGDGFGEPLAIGDFDDDGKLDLAIGAWDEELPVNKFSAGLIQVLPGDTGGLTAPGTTFTQDTAGVPGPSQPNAQFGRTLSVGDFDGDGFDDLVAAAAGASVDVTVPTPATIPFAGVIVVLYGSAGGLGGGGSDVFSEPSGAVAFNQFGSTLLH